MHGALAAAAAHPAADFDNAKYTTTSGSVASHALFINSSSAISRWAYQAKKEEEEQINVVLFVKENQIK